MEENKYLVGKTCNILVNVNGEPLNFRARVLYIGIFHITFIDKFKKIYSFNLKNVLEVEELEDEENKHFWEKSKTENGKNGGGEEDGII